MNFTEEARELLFGSKINETTTNIIANRIAAALQSAYERGEQSAPAIPAGKAFKYGDLVRKKSGSWWEGKVVGFYSTNQTQEGYCVQLEQPNGPVQIYPVSALEAAPTPETENE